MEDIETFRRNLFAPLPGKQLEPEQERELIADEMAAFRTVAGQVGGLKRKGA